MSLATVTAASEPRLARSASTCTSPGASRSARTAISSSYAAPREAIDHAGYADAVLAELDGRAPTARSGRARERLLRRRHAVALGPGGARPRARRRSRGAFGTDAAAIEITVECNPTSLDEDRARALVDVGVNRLSIGVQGSTTSGCGSSAASTARDGRRRGGPRRRFAPASRASRRSHLRRRRPSRPTRPRPAKRATLADLGATHVSAYS